MKRRVRISFWTDDRTLLVPSASSSDISGWLASSSSSSSMRPRFLRQKLHETFKINCKSKRMIYLLSRFSRRSRRHGISFVIIDANRLAVLVYVETNFDASFKTECGTADAAVSRFGRRRGRRGLSRRWLVGTRRWWRRQRWRRWRDRRQTDHIANQR